MSKTTTSDDFSPEELKKIAAAARRGHDNSVELTDEMLAPLRELLKGPVKDEDLTSTPRL